MAKPRKILVVSHFGCFSEAVSRMMAEGNHVRYCILDKESRDISDGLVKKVPTWERYVDESDLIVFDDSTFGKTCDELRDKGKIVLGPSVYSDKLEMDRGFGQQEMKKAGMSVLPDWTFQSLDEAINFVKKNPGRYVVKPDGKAQDEKALTYVGKSDDGKDIVDTLENYKKKWAGKIKSIQVQTFVKGVEVAVTAFWNGNKYIMPAFLNTEYKKQMDGDLGANTGEMGETSQWISHCKFFEDTLAKFAPCLQGDGYRGPIDINTICNADGVWPLEFTPRFGWPPFWIQQESIQSKLGDFLYACAAGEDFDLKVDPGYQCCVVVAKHPYPFEDPKAFNKYSKDAKVEFKEPGLGGIYLSDVKQAGKDLSLAGASGYVAICVGKGMTMDEAREEAYKRAKSITLPDAFYRTDIGHKWHKDHDLLHAWGLL